MAGRKRKITGESVPVTYSFGQALHAETPDSALEIVRRMVETKEVAGVALLRLKHLHLDPIDFRRIENETQLARFGRDHAMEMIEYDHFEIIKGEAPRVPDDGSAVHPLVANVFCLRRMQNLQQALANMSQ